MLSGMLRRAMFFLMTALLLIFRGGPAFPLDSDTVTCDVAVIGGTPSGIAAAIQSARLGVNTCLIEETGWLGGQFITIGSFDGGRGTGNNNGIFWELKKRVHDFYGGWGAASTCLVSDTCFEPGVMNSILREMVESTKNLTLYLNTAVVSVQKKANVINGIIVRAQTKGEISMKTKIIIDAGLYGDVIAMSGAAFLVGIDKDSREPSSEKAYVEGALGLQPPTFTMVLKKYAHDASIPRPEGYYAWKFNNWTWDGKWRWMTDDPSDPGNSFLRYIYLPSGKIIINWPVFGNDFPGVDVVSSPQERLKIFEMMKSHSLQFLYHLQADGHKTWSLSCEDFDTKDCFPPFPYIRESRRVKGVQQLNEWDVTLTNSKATSHEEYSQKRFRPDAITYVDYAIDFHQVVPEPCLPDTGCDPDKIGKGLKGRCTGIGNTTGRVERHDVLKASVPYGVLVPLNIDGLLAAEQNISVTHIANGTTRLGPACMRIGQAAGAAAALSVRSGIQPRDVNVADLQDILISQRAAVYFFSDVQADYWAFPSIQKAAIKKVMTAYDDDSFRPEQVMTRGQATVAIMKASGQRPSAKCTGTKYSDINSKKVGEEMCKYIENFEYLSACDVNVYPGKKKGYCPDQPVTRTEVAVALAKSLALQPDNTCTGKIFGDVSSKGRGDSECRYIEKLAARVELPGCDKRNFCPDGHVTRAIMADFLAKTFF